MQPSGRTLPRPNGEPSHSASSTNDPFIGRAVESAQLDSLLASVLSGRGGLVTVAGEPGIGKTTLLERLARDAAEAGQTVAWASCWQGPDRPSFWPWVQLLRALDPSAASLLETPGGESRARLFDDVVAYLREVSGAGAIVLIIDDLHWADAASVRLLMHAARSLRGAAVLLAAAYRDSELVPGDPVCELVADLVPLGHISLAGLSTTEIAALTTTVAGGQEIDARVLQRRTGGNPLFVRELLRWLTAEGRLDNRNLESVIPEGIRAVLERRLNQLPSKVHQVLGVASVIGEEFDVSLLAAAAGFQGDEVAELLEDAAAARLVTLDDPGRGCFAHPLLRDVRYTGLRATERTGLHRAVARELESLSLSDPDSYGQTIAYHLLRAGPERAADASNAAVRAAGRALAVLDHEGAVALLRDAVEASSVAGATPARKAELALLLGDALVRVGDMPAARKVHLEAAALARRADEATLLGRAALGYGTGLVGFEVRLWDRSQVDLLEEALAALPGDASALRASLVARLAVALSLTDRPERREPLSREAVAMAREAGDAEALAYALSSYADVIAGPDHVAERLGVASEIIALSQRAGSTPLELLGRRFRIVALLEQGSLAELDTEITAYASLAERLRQPLFSWYVPLWLGMRALLDGRFADCERLLAEAIAIGEHAHSDNADMLTKTQLVSLWEAQGRAAGGLAELGISIDVPEEARLSPVVRAFTAMLAMHVGQHARAQAELDRFTASGFAELPRDAEYLSNLSGLTQVAVRLNDSRAAAAIVPLLEPYADLLVVDGIGAACEGSVHRFLGLLAMVQGRGDEAVERLERAVDTHARLGALPLATHCRLELARALRARGCPGDVDRAARVGAVAVAAAHELGITIDDSPVSGSTQPAVADPADEPQFRPEGGVWLLVYAGKTARVKDAKGLRDLARLLSSPGQAVHVSELVTSPPPRARAAPGVEDGLTAASGPVVDPVLDATARDAYRRRIADLREEIDDAESCNDPYRATRAREELDLLTTELARAFGLGGRPRTVGDPVERARKAVAGRIREAIARIDAVHPDLARHLEHSVRTGTRCVYEPEQPLRWRT